MPTSYSEVSLFSLKLPSTASPHFLDAIPQLLNIGTRHGVTVFQLEWDRFDLFLWVLRRVKMEGVRNDQSFFLHQTVKPANNLLGPLQSRFYFPESPFRSFFHRMQDAHTNFAGVVHQTAGPVAGHHKTSFLVMT